MSVRAAVARFVVIAVMLCARARVAGADSVPDASDPADREASAAFRAALDRSAAHDPHAIDAFEELGARRPITRWTDDAWAEAARLAEIDSDYARARHALEQVIALGGTDKVAQRSRATLARLTAMTGNGAWDAVAKEHERLTDAVFGGGDPRAELHELERLVEANAGYPRANAIRRVLAVGWEQEAETERALHWFREAARADSTEPGGYASLELVRALIRADHLDDAEHELARLEAPAMLASLDRAGLASVREQLSTAEHRTWRRRGIWGGLVLLLIAALVVLRRQAGSGRAAASRLARPPGEVLFLVPIAALLIAVAYTGNPLVAHAVRDITIGGVVLAWLSGSVLEATRARLGRVRLGRTMIHALLALLGVAAIAYLAIDAEHLIDFIRETWRGGPSLR